MTRKTIQTYIALTTDEYRELRKLAFDLRIPLTELLARLARKALQTHNNPPSENKSHD